MAHFMINEAAKITNEVLGEKCTYTNYNGEQKEVFAIINKNKKVLNDFGVLQGYSVTAAITKAELTSFDNGDTLATQTGETWIIRGLEQETVGKWYFAVTQG